MGIRGSATRAGASAPRGTSSAGSSVGGATSTVKAIQDGKGDIDTDPHDMIGVLQEYRAEVFRERGIDEAKLKEWLEERYPDDGEPSRDRIRGVDG